MGRSWGSVGARHRPHRGGFWGATALLPPPTPSPPAYPTQACTRGVDTLARTYTHHSSLCFLPADDNIVPALNRAHAPQHTERVQSTSTYSHVARLSAHTEHRTQHKAFTLLTKDTNISHKLQKYHTHTYHLHTHTLQTPCILPRDYTSHPHTEVDITHIPQHTVPSLHN